MWKKIEKWILTTCWVSGHDWYVIREEKEHTDYGCIITHQQKICLQCKKWIDEINPYRETVKRREFNKKSRAERAKELWDDRYNPNW